MHTHRLFALAVLALAAVAIPEPQLHASGTYRGGSPAPRAGGSPSHVDQDLYAYGKRIFENKVPLQAAARPESQAPRLTALQSRLPKRVAKKKDLVALSGRLDPGQLQALEYYVNSRFGR